MAKISKTAIQNYPRIQDEKDPYHGFFDDSKVTPNTEVWLSDYFWPFFSNCSYEDIIKTVLQVLMEDGGVSSLDINIPEELLTSFGKECENYGLLDEKGNFNDPEKLVDLFCGKLSKHKK